MLNAQTITDKIIIKDIFITDIENLVKRVISQIIMCVLCFLGFSVIFLLATRIVLLMFLFVCMLMNYFPSIPFLTG